MNFEDIANEDEFNEENSQLKNSSKNNNKINNEINKSNNKDSSSDKEKELEENDEKALLLEIKNLEKEKEIFFQKRKEQNDILEKYMNLLKSLQTKNDIELKNITVEETNFELDELIKYNSLISKIESEERILQEEENYFEQYKNKFNEIYEEKQKEIEDMRLNYEKEKEEINKRLEILEMEEKIINDKYNNFEYEKKLITERYNDAMNKEANLLKYKNRIENTLNELDKRNIILEKNNQLINETNNQLQYQILKNSNEEKRLLNEKNNLKLRQDMIDSLRIKYVGDLTNTPFELMSKTYNENIGKQKNNLNNDINEFKNNLNNNFDINKKKNEEFIENNNNEINQKKLSIIEEEIKLSDKSEFKNGN